MDVLVEDVSNSDEEQFPSVPRRAHQRNKQALPQNILPFKLPCEHGHQAGYPEIFGKQAAFAESLFVKREFQEMDFTMERDSRTTFLAVFSPDGLTVATTHGDHDIRIFNTVTRKRLMTLTGHPRTPWTVSFHPISNTLLASGCLSGQVRVWDIVNGGSEKFSVVPASVITSVCFHPVEKCVAFATGNCIYLWDWSTNQLITRMETWSERLNYAHKAVMYVRFDPTGTRLLTAIANASAHRAHVRSRVAASNSEERDSRYEELLSSYENLRHSYRSLFNWAMSRPTNDSVNQSPPPPVPAALDEASRILFPSSRGSPGSGRQTSIREYAVPRRTYRSESPSSSENEDGPSSPSRPPRRPSFTYWSRSAITSRSRSRGRYARQQSRTSSNQFGEGNRLPGILASLDSELDVMRRLTVFRRQVSYPYHSYRSLIDRLQQVRLMLIQLRHELQMVNESSERNETAAHYGHAGERTNYHRRLQMETQRARESTTSLTRAISAVSDEIDNVFSADPLRPRTSSRRRGMHRRLPYRRERGRSPSDEELLALPPPPPPPGSPPPLPPLRRPFDETVSEARTDEAAILDENEAQASTSSGAAERRGSMRNEREASLSTTSASEEGPEGYLSSALRRLRELQSREGSNQPEGAGASTGSTSTLEERLFAVVQCFLDCVSRVLRVYTLQQTEESSERRQGLVDLIHSLRSLILHFLEGEGVDVTQQEENPLRRFIPRLDELAMEASRVLRSTETSNVDTVGYALLQSAIDGLRDRTAAAAPSPGVTSGLADLSISPPSASSNGAEGTAALRRHLDTLVEQLIVNRSTSRERESTRRQAETSSGEPRGQTRARPQDETTRAEEPEPRRPRLLSEINASSGEELNRMAAQRGVQHMWGLEVANQTRRNELLRAHSGPDLAPIVDSVLNNLRHREDPQSEVDLGGDAQAHERVVEDSDARSGELRAQSVQDPVPNIAATSNDPGGHENHPSRSATPTLEESLGEQSARNGLSLEDARARVNQARRNDQLRAQRGPDLGPIVDNVLGFLRSRENGTSGNQAQQGSREEADRRERSVEDLTLQAERLARARLSNLMASQRESREDSDSAPEESVDNSHGRPARWLSDLRDRIRAHTQRNSENIGERSALVSDARHLIMEHVRLRQELNRLRSAAGANQPAPVGPPPDEAAAAQAEEGAAVDDVAELARERQSTLQSIRRLFARRTTDSNTQARNRRSALPSVERAFGLIDDALSPEFRPQQRLRPGVLSSSPSVAEPGPAESQNAPVNAADASRPVAATLADRHRRLIENLLRADNASRGRSEVGEAVPPDQPFRATLMEHVRLRMQHQTSQSSAVNDATSEHSVGETSTNGSESGRGLAGEASSAASRQRGGGRPTLDERLESRDWYSRIQQLRFNAETREGASGNAARARASEDSETSRTRPADPRLIWPPRPLVRQNAVASSMDVHRRIMEVPTQEFVCQYMPPNYRIQCWDFTTTLPDLGNARENVVVPACKIHCDGWIDISTGWDLLVAIYPKSTETFGASVGVYSLQKKTLGQVLWTTSLSNSVVSVSLSPSAKFLVVGVTGSRLFGSYPGNKQTIAKVYTLDPNAKREKESENPGIPLSFVRDIERTLDTVSWSLNSIRWSPHTANGLVMCTNKGHVKVLY